MIKKGGLHKLINKLKKKVVILLKGEIEYYRCIGVKIGNNCSFNGAITFGSEPYLISLGDNVRCANNVTFVTHDGGMHVLRNLGLKNVDKFGSITIQNNVFIGANTIIMPNVKIGNNVVVGAGSVITKNIDDNCVVAGIPAKYICSIEEYYKKNINKTDNTKSFNSKEKRNYLINKYKL